MKHHPFSGISSVAKAQIWHPPHPRPGISSLAPCRPGASKVECPNCPTDVLMSPVTAEFPINHHVKSKNSALQSMDFTAGLSMIQWSSTQALNPLATGPSLPPGDPHGGVPPGSQPSCREPFVDDQHMEIQESTKGTGTCFSLESCEGDWGLMMVSGAFWDRKTQIRAWCLGYSMLG